MAILSAAKTKISIGTTTVPATMDAAGFAADTYKDIGSVESIAAFGDQYSDISFSSLSDGRVQHLKGSADAGTMQVTFAFDSADDGQTAVKAALDDTGNAPYNFSVTLNDKPSAGTNATTYYFRGFISEYRLNPGSVNDIVKVEATILLTSGVVVKAAA